MKTKFNFITFVFIISSAIVSQAQTNEQQTPSTESQPVYLMISYDIVNFEEFKKYPPQVLPLLQKYGAEVLASDLQAIPFEGSPKMMNAIIKFPSREAAYKCYQDPAYEPLKKLRIESTQNGTLVLVKQFQLPKQTNQN